MINPANISSTSFLGGSIPPHLQPGRLPSSNAAATVPSVGSTTDTAAFAAVNMNSLPATLGELQRNLKQVRERSVDTEKAAAVINAVRRQSLLTHYKQEGEAGSSNKALAESISEAHVDQWMEALGLQPKDVDAMKKAAFWSGISNPFGSDTMTAMAYIATPLIGAVADTPFATLVLGLTAAVAAPAINAWFQTGVVTRGDIYRECKGPTVVLNKDDVNDKLSLEQAAKLVADRTQKFGYALQSFEGTINACKLGLGLAPAAPIQAQHLQTLAPQQQAVLQWLADEVLSSSNAMCEAQQQALMTQGSHARQQLGNARQAVPRTVRPIGAGLPGLLTGSKKVGRDNLVSSIGAAGVQTGAAFLGMFAQHYAAGIDERNKQMYHNKLNMLYADVFTPAGKEKSLLALEPTGADIDPAKLRKLVSSPSEAFMVRVIDTMMGRIAKIDRAIDAATRTSAVSHNPQTQGSTLDVPFGNTAPLPQRTDPLQPLEEEKARLSADVGKLEAGNLLELSIHTVGSPAGTGVARKIIEEGLASLGLKSSLGLSKLFNPLPQFRSPIVNAALEKKYNTQGEWSAQTIQRVGQAAHLVIAGSGSASVIGRVSSAAVMGSKNATTAQVLGVTAAAGVLGGIGAAYQYVAISEKNNRRANLKTVSAEMQFSRSAMAAIREPRGMKATTKAITAANERIHDALAILTDARAVVAALPKGGFNRPENNSVSPSGIRQSARQTALQSQLPARTKNKKEYFAEWDAWAENSTRTKERRAEAVDRMKAWLNAGRDEEILDLQGLYLTSLPESLPASLQVLDVSRNCFVSFPDSLPASLKRLHIACSRLNGPLLNLPASLEYLDIRGNRRITFPQNFPDSLIELHCHSAGITNVPDNLPDSLKILDLQHNSGLSSLPESLPALLEELNVGYCRLEHLPQNLPASLRILIAPMNLLERLTESLPASIEKLDVSYNCGLATLPSSPPASLKELNVELTFVDDIVPIIWTMRLWINNAPPGAEAGYQLFGQQIMDAWNNPDQDKLSINSAHVSTLPKLPPHLKTLALIGCTSLESVPDLIACTELVNLEIDGCIGLTSPPRLDSCPNLMRLIIRNCSGFTEPPDLQKNSKLTRLQLNGCSGLSTSPDIAHCPGLETLEMRGCSGVRGYPNFESATQLRNVNLIGVAFTNSFEGLLSLPQQCVVHLAPSDLTSTMRRRLRAIAAAADYAGPRIQFASRPVTNQPQRPANLSVVTASPNEEFTRPENNSGSPSGIGQSARKPALQSQLPARTKNKEEYFAEWDAWAENGTRTNERRTEAVDRMKAWLNAGRDTEILDLQGLYLTSLPEGLPASLQVLDVSRNCFVSFPDSLPASLKRLHIACSSLNGSLLNLPPSLEYLDIRGNRRITFPQNFPASLVELHCRSAGITSVPDNLPASLKILDLQHNSGLSSLSESLPASLEELNVGYCRLKHLPQNLPALLKLLIAPKNLIEKLTESLPASIEKIDVSYNCDLAILPSSPPVSLKELNVEFTLVDGIVPINWKMRLWINNAVLSH